MIDATVIDRSYNFENGDTARSRCSNAKIDEVAGEHGAAIKIKLRAPAVERKANTALITFLAERLRVPKLKIVLLRGHKSRDKLVRVDGLSEEELRRRLLRLCVVARCYEKGKLQHRENKECCDRGEKGPERMQRDDIIELQQSHTDADNAAGVKNNDSAAGRFKFC